MAYRKSGTRDPGTLGLVTRDSGPGTQDSKPGTRDSGHGTRDSGLGTQTSPFSIVVVSKKKRIYIDPTTKERTHSSDFTHVYYHFNYTCMSNHDYFLIPSSNENNLIYFLVNKNTEHTCNNVFRVVCC